LEPLPLRVGEFFAFHTGECTPPARVCKHALAQTYGPTQAQTISPEAALPPHVQQALATTRPCPRCGAIDTPSLGPGTAVHYARLLCQHCGCFLLWISRYSAEEQCARREQARREAMAKKLPTASQLGYLAALGDTGPPPANMLEASDRIEALRRGKGVA
jgi:hypothetical protein